MKDDDEVEWYLYGLPYFQGAFIIEEEGEEPFILGSLNVYGYLPTYWKITKVGKQELPPGEES